jgi:hypothetical protein
MGAVNGEAQDPGVAMVAGAKEFMSENYGSSGLSKQPKD